MKKTALNKQMEIIKYEKFIEKQYIKKDIFVALFFAILFVIIGTYENNLFLSDNGLGLFEHVNIWIFLFTNMIIPVAMSGIFKKIQKNLDEPTWEKLKENFSINAKAKSIIILSNFIKSVGFCCFIGNSLQNANVINRLPFNYWDSINYIGSYVVSRIYKLYLFTYFIPSILIYVYISIKSLSELLEITDSEMEEYPIKKYDQLNVLCNLGLDILLIMAVQFIPLSIGVVFVHDRIDIISSTGIIISIISAIVFICMYALLIRKYRASIIKYIENNVKQINSELVKIHQFVFNFEHGKNQKKQLEVCLKKEKYLRKVKKRIEKLSKYPFVIKAIFTSITPAIPTLLKLGFQILKTFFKIDLFATIL